MDLNRISRAFYLGYLWSLGRRFAMDRAMAMDAKRDLRDVRWVTINGTHVPISKKTGKIVGPLKNKIELTKARKVGPDKLPTLWRFVTDHNLQNEKLPRQIKKYMNEFYFGRDILNPKGLPKAKKIVFNKRGFGETAGKINKDKVKALPFIADIYRTGTYAGCSIDKKGTHPDVKYFHYTKKDIVILGEKYRVTLCAKERNFKGRDGEYEFSHYLIDKADK